MMMMPFIVLAETKHGLRPYTRPTSTPPPERKINICDNAPAMNLVVRWWFSIPFGTRGRVISPLSSNHPQCPFYK
jgi:hypothetical protein